MIIGEFLKMCDIRVAISNGFNIKSAGTVIVEKMQMLQQFRTELYAKQIQPTHQQCAEYLGKIALIPEVDDIEAAAWL